MDTYEETDRQHTFDDDYGEDDEYYPSSTCGDYGPSCPWNAPGMSVSDFL